MSTDMELCENFNAYMCKYISEDNYNRYYTLVQRPEESMMCIIENWTHPTKGKPTYADLKNYTLQEALDSVSLYTFDYLF